MIEAGELHTGILGRAISATAMSLGNVAGMSGFFGRVNSTAWTITRGGCLRYGHGNGSHVHAY